jgi:hypothetical protein
VAGIFQTDWSWAALIQDFDNDGWRDFFISNGYYRDVTNADFMEFTMDSLAKLPGGFNPDMAAIEGILKDIPQFKLRNYAYRNKGTETSGIAFADASTAWGFVEKSYSNGAAYADLDNDGDLDLVVNNLFEPAFIYQNTAADRKQGNWLQLDIKGGPKNPFAVGAKIRAWAGDQVYSQELYPVRGFFSSVAPLVHFGLGTISTLDRVEVLFPEGRLISLTDVPVNQRLTIRFDEAKPGKLTPLPAPMPLAKEISGTAFHSRPLSRRRRRERRRVAGFLHRRSYQPGRGAFRAKQNGRFYQIFHRNLGSGQILRRRRSHFPRCRPGR